MPIKAYQKVGNGIAGSCNEYDVSGKAERQAAHISKVICKITCEDVPRKQGAHAVAGSPCELILERYTSLFDRFFFHIIPLFVGPVFN